MNTATQRFIEDAVKGGWNIPDIGYGSEPEVTDNGLRWSYADYVSIHEILLDPSAWRAVGKTRGWRDYISYRIKCIYL